VSQSSKPKLLFAVTNDLSYDQRMDRICSALSENEFDCTIIGRKKSNSIGLSDKSYKTRRINLGFQKGKLFYLEYNFKLFWIALFSRCDVYCAIDLDTYIPFFLAAKLRGKKLTYDAHEYFSELEEVVNRPLVHFIWQKVESVAMRTANAYYTISEGYAGLFHSRYNQIFKVVRNVPRLSVEQIVQTSEKPFIIYQGALNVGRGLEESVLAMHHISGLQLRIYGEGPISGKLEKLIQNEKLDEKVSLMGAALPTDLRTITTQAFAGLTLFSETGLHHQYSLANRFFDYLHAGIPQIAMNYSEYKAFNEKYSIALLIDELSEDELAKGISELQSNPELASQLKNNCILAACENNWQIESKKLLEIYLNL